LQIWDWANSLPWDKVSKIMFIHICKKFGCYADLWEAKAKDTVRFTHNQRSRQRISMKKFAVHASADLFIYFFSLLIYAPLAEDKVSRGSW
jgi:hypothetical protein